MGRVTVEVELIPEQCCNCGCWFGLDSRIRQRYLETGETFYCPNGHGQVFSESKVQKLQRALENERESKVYWRARAENEKRSHAATKGHMTRIKNRVSHGVCPCCNRNFDNLRKHMKTEHPDYIEEAKAEGE